MIGKGFVKICLATPKLAVGNPDYNVSEMLSILKDNPSSLTVFPELGISGYTCGDMFFHKALFDDVEKALGRFLKENRYPGLVICGLPLVVEEMVLNVAIVIQKDRILGIVPKYYLPSTREYYEKRWFKSGFDVVEHITKTDIMGQVVPFGNLIFSFGNVRFGIEICEDMWATITPGNLMSVNGANLIINISASNETLGKEEIRRSAVKEHSRKNCGIYLYCSAGASESSSEMVFSGHDIVAMNGHIVAETEEFSLNTIKLFADLDIDRITNDRRNNSSFRDSILKYRYQFQNVPVTLATSDDFIFSRPLEKFPFVPKDDIEGDFRKIASIQEYALAKRLDHLKIKHLLVGVSGGLDSALALLVACRAFDTLKLDRKGILALTLPALHTSGRTNKNAKKLMESLGVSVKEIDLSESVKKHLELIRNDSTTENTTYENAQARARTMVLMDLANEIDGIVLGTGDLSEIALGWSTYNGDQMSMYNVNAGIPKTVVSFMIKEYADLVFSEDVSLCLYDILATPITPELKSDQTTESVIGKYEINDFILYRFLSCGDGADRIVFLLEKTFDMNQAECETYVSNFFKRFFSQQFKRQASPDSPKVLDVALSPRTDFRLPSDMDR
ncbi:MAG TPA: NAD(+) synthase [Bacillota bacterium]|nr:NAD(+) synthase [Bacillota bacterium]HPF42396.1 NAD(+) synthase [Bacillota bacterium]HPJ85391.1 NAD(+) synthase [Bacillota bacterium]HPQ61313.1 NAD(+) synthase [Bacillota bacterium]